MGVLERTPPALLNKILEPLTRDEEHGLKRNQAHQVRERVVKEGSTNAKRPTKSNSKKSKVHLLLIQHM